MGNCNCGYKEHCSPGVGVSGLHGGTLWAQTKVSEKQASLSHKSIMDSEMPLHFKSMLDMLATECSVT